MSGLTKKKRFEVFKRDRFTCTYCGQQPPAVVLEVDHIVARANGGPDSLDNLATSCFDCNRGKSDKALGAVPATIADRADLLREREEQAAAFRRLLRRQQKRIDTDIDAIQAVLIGDTDAVFTDRFRLSVKHFLQELSLDRVTFAAERAFQKVHAPDPRIKYFCGICWKLIRDTRNEGS